MRKDFLLHVSIAIVGLSVLLGVLANEGYWLLPNRSICFSRGLLDRECPGCGLTRSFVAAGGGHLRQSWESNPLGPVLFGLNIAFLLSRVSAGKEKRPRLQPFEVFLLGAAFLIVATRVVWYYVK